MNGIGRLPEAGERRTSSVRVPSSFEEEPYGDLQQVLQEISDLMHADGALLTMHPDNAAPTLVYAERRLRDSGLHDPCFDLCRKVRSRFDAGCCFWREAEDGHALFLMPVDRMPGHSQVVIGILFKKVTRDRRLTAERLYRERRPLATGFFRLWQKGRVIQQRTRALEAVLDHTELGVILIAQSGQIAFVNETAEELLAAGDGLGRVGHALRASHLSDGVHLQAALSHAMAGAEQAGSGNDHHASMLAFRRRAGPPLVASILPAPDAPVERNDISAIMYLIDPEVDTQWMLVPLCRLYGLSKVETSLLCQLASGHTIAAAAQAIRVKEQTARSYLKAIFVKTGTNRQVDLIVLMLSSVIRMRRSIKHEAMQPSSLHRVAAIDR